MNHAHGWRTLAALALSVVLASAAAADWNPDPEVGTPVCTYPNDQDDVRAIPDGGGGMLVSWIDARYSGEGVFMQRMDCAGNLLWPGDALVIQADADIYSHDSCSDGAGGALVAAAQVYGGFYHVFVQRILADGTLAWPAPVDVTPDVSGSSQLNPALATDGSGGAVVVWQDYRNAGTHSSDLWAQRVDAAGVRQWGGSGKPVCVELESQAEHVVVPSAWTGAVIVVWEDDRHYAVSETDIFAAQLMPDGDPLWAPNGMSLCQASSFQLGPFAIPTTDGGAIVVWEDRRLTENNYDIYGQRIGWNGAEMWASEGKAICREAEWQHSPVLADDGADGAWVAWIDDRNDGYEGWHVYVQRLNASGDGRWPGNGQLATYSDGIQYMPALAATSDGELVVGFRDNRFSGADGFAQKFSREGDLRWGYDGTAVCTAAYGLPQPIPVADPLGGALFAWRDGRGYSQYDVYAQRVDSWGYRGDPAPVGTAVIDAPQDQGGVVLLEWSGSYLDAPPENTITHYDVWRLYYGVVQPRLPVGEAGCPDPRPDVAKEGVSGLLKSGWTQVGRVDAFGLGVYGYDAPSYADSTGAGIPVTAYMVLAHAVDGSYWPSNILLGYSVDNLAPGAPKVLAAAMAGVDAHLDWSPAGVDDEDLSAYNVYRSDTPGFTPGGASFVVATPDTAWIDAGLPAGAWYYRVSGVDVHGNEGPPSNEAQVESVTDAGGTPRAFAVRAYPNPFNPAVSFSYRLPRDGRIALTVYDARGKLAARVVDAFQRTGPHEARWDASDMPSGVYLYRVETSWGERRTGEIMLVR